MNPRITDVNNKIAQAQFCDNQIENVPRTETLGENLCIRVPRGIRAEVEALRAKER